MLADDFMDPRNQLMKSVDDNQLRQYVTVSHKFVLDDEATRMCVAAALAYPEIVDQMLPLARLPYERVWIEVPRGVKLDAQHAMGTSRGNIPPAPSHPDCRIGYYLERDTPTGTRWRAMVTEHNVDGPPSYFGWPIGFLVDPQGLLDADVKFPEDVSTMRQVAGDIWGYQADQPGLDKLFHKAAITVNPSLHMEIDDPSDPRLHEMLRELSGTVRFIVAALATMASVPVQLVDRKPKGRRLVNRAPRGFFGYQQATLMLPRRVPREPSKWVQSQIIQQARKLRQHSVRGHWRRYASGKLSWVHEHTRGDASIGVADRTVFVKGRNSG